MSNLCAWYSVTSMSLNRHNDTLNTYLVDANLRMAKLLNILTYLFLFLYSRVLLLLHTRVLWLFLFRDETETAITHEYFRLHL